MPKKPSRVSPKVPSHCPRLKKCRKKIDEVDYELNCMNEHWLYCPGMEKEALKYRPRITPKEWRIARKLAGIMDEEI